MRASRGWRVLETHFLLELPELDDAECVSLEADAAVADEMRAERRGGLGEVVRSGVDGPAAAVVEEVDLRGLRVRDDDAAGTCGEMDEEDKVSGTSTEEESGVVALTLAMTPSRAEA